NNVGELVPASTVHRWSIGTQPRIRLRESDSQQSGRHRVTMAATSRHFSSRKPVWDLAKIGRQGQPAGELTIMPPPLDPSRDLLFGLLALQTGLINQIQLVAAFHAWTQARDRPMAEILAEQGALETPCLTLVEGLVIEHLRRHGNDPERSLAAMGLGQST